MLRVSRAGQSSKLHLWRFGPGSVAGLALALALLVSAAGAQEAIAPDQGPGKAVADEGYDHVSAGTPITYAHRPPASGPHYPTWLRSGLYAEPHETGYWVHSLEHGYVVVLYNCSSDCPDLQGQLQQFYEAAPKSASFGYQKLVILPYSDMDHKLAAVAWDRIDELDQFDAGRLLAFYEAYADRGPENAP